MPELKPCPACNNVESIIHMSFIAGKTIWFVECDDDNCAHHGKACFTEAAAIAAWNALPRALTWTTEPPQVEGWYLWRASKGQNVSTLWIWSRSGVFGYYFDSEFITELSRGEWAGPIPTPLEPEES